MVLHAFERTALRSSFKLAAQELALTPSAVSHQIRSLEKQLGVKLFSRSGRRISLTPEGERYLRYVRSALTLLEHAQRDVSADHGVTREIRLSALPFVVQVLVLPKLKTFLSRHSDVTIRVEASNQYADFEQSGVDLAIRMGREHAAGLLCESLIDVRAIPVCSPRLATRRSPLTEPSNLAGQVLIQNTQQPDAWPLWLASAGAEGLKPKGELWFDSIPLALEAARAGLGVALAMDPLIRSFPGFGDDLIAPWELPGDQVRSYFIISRPQHRDDPVLAAFRAWLKGAVAV